jgi:hypothetical protein
MKAILKTQALPKILLVILALGLALSYGCTSNPRTSSETKLASDSDGNAVPRNPDGMILARGTVVNVSSNYDKNER